MDAIGSENLHFFHQELSNRNNTNKSYYAILDNITNKKIINLASEICQITVDKPDCKLMEKVITRLSEEERKSFFKKVNKFIEKEFTGNIDKTKAEKFIIFLQSIPNNLPESPILKHVSKICQINIDKPTSKLMEVSIKKLSADERNEFCTSIANFAAGIKEESERLNFLKLVPFDYSHQVNTETKKIIDQIENPAPQLITKRVKDLIRKSSVFTKLCKISSSSTPIPPNTKTNERKNSILL